MELPSQDSRILTHFAAPLDLMSSKEMVLTVQSSDQIAWRGHKPKGGARRQADVKSLGSHPTPR